jgi:hypothetical protein
MPELGIFWVADAEDHETTVARALATEDAGLDYVRDPGPRLPVALLRLVDPALLSGRANRADLSAPHVLNLRLRVPSVVATTSGPLTAERRATTSSPTPRPGHVPDLGSDPKTFERAFSGAAAA